MQLSEALVRVIDACDGSGIEYALAGGFAYSIYCEPRSTVDIDIVLISDVASAEQTFRGWFSSVYRNLETMEYPLVRVHRLLLMEDDQEFILDLLEPVDADLLRAIQASTRSIEFRDRQVPVIAPEFLYLLKRSSSRQRDALDAEALQRTMGATMDYSVISQWLPDGPHRTAPD